MVQSRTYLFTAATVISMTATTTTTTTTTTRKGCTISYRHLGF